MATFLSERYELVHLAAEGPIAELHAGRLRGSAGFVRPVAIRKLAPRYAKDPRFVGTWAATATAIAERPSPHLEEVLDLVVDGERVYVVTEWIEGLSLPAFLASYEHPPWTLVTRILVGILDGLHRLHTLEAPLVHRGVTPGAVRVSQDGAVKLTRAGIAAGLATIGEGRAHTLERGLAHPAPELLEGRAATPATDVFGLGALALEALAAGPAFSGGDLAEPRDLAAIRKDVPPLLVALIERALRPEPDDRFETADELARALERLLHAEATPVDEASLGRAVRSARDRAPRSRTGPAALAASLGRMRAPGHETRIAVPERKKHPVGLPAEHTHRVEDAELTPLDSVVPIPEEGEHDAPEDGARHARPPGLAHAESEALPFALAKIKVPVGLAGAKTELSASPRGLAPQKTEVLDEGEVDRLTLEPSKAPRGLAPQKTEFLDEGEVDRLTIEPTGPARGLSPKKTELLDEGEVDRLTLEPSKAPRGLGPARTEHLGASEVDRLTVEPAKPPRLRPRGLAPSKTEHLDASEVDRLRLEEEE